MKWTRGTAGPARRAGSIVAALVVWVIVSRSIGTDVVPGPALVVPDAWQLISSGTFAGPLGTSLVRVVFGFLLGFAAAVAYGVAAGRSRNVRYAASWVFQALLFEPTLVVIFLGILVFGPNDLAAVLIVAIMVFPAVGVYIRDVLGSFDRDLSAMATAFHAGVRRRMMDMYVPYLIPAMLAGGRVGFSHAWKVVILVEVFGVTGGMGFQIRQNFRVFNLPLMLAWLVIFILVLLALEEVLRASEKRFVKWNA